MHCSRAAAALLCAQNLEASRFPRSAERAIPVAAGHHWFERNRALALLWHRDVVFGEEGIDVWIDCSRCSDVVRRSGSISLLRVGNSPTVQSWSRISTYLQRGIKIGYRKVRLVQKQMCQSACLIVNVQSWLELDGVVQIRHGAISVSRDRVV